MALRVAGGSLSEDARRLRGDIEARSRLRPQVGELIAFYLKHQLPLPPRSLELNPVENVWQFMRDNWLSNRVYTSYDDIVALCCEAWNNLIDRTWKIMSIGMRQWAYEC